MKYSLPNFLLLSRVNDLIFGVSFRPAPIVLTLIVVSDVYPSPLLITVTAVSEPVVGLITGFNFAPLPEPLTIKSGRE